MSDQQQEQIAIALWHRFAPEGHMEWSEERHQAEYRDAADAVLLLTRIQPNRLLKLAEGCRTKADLYRQAHPEIPASFTTVAIELERIARGLPGLTSERKKSATDSLHHIPDAAQAAVVTDEMVQRACETYSEVYADDDKDMGDAMLAVLKEALAAQPPAAPVETDAEIEALERTVEQLTSDLSTLDQAVVKACDLLAERTYGNSARSPGHNARLVLERALAERLPVHPRLSAETSDAGCAKALIEPWTVETSKCPHCLCSPLHCNCGVYSNAKEAP